MHIEALLEGISYQTENDIKDVLISGIVSDSRNVRPGDLFIAVSGQTFDGHNYIQEAIDNDCAAVLIESGRPVPLDRIRTTAPIIEVKDSRLALGFIAASYFGHPGRALKMIAVTGTNGKTTTSYLIEGVIKAAGGRPGVIGTVNYRYHNKLGETIEEPAPFTTPEPIALHRLLRQMVDNKVTHVAMEVSSHALAQNRLIGLWFDIAVFTNLSRDHLDFHGNMDNYFASKKKLFFEHLKPDGQAIIILDGPQQEKTERNGQSARSWGRRLATELEAMLKHSKTNGPNNVRPTTAIPKTVITCGIENSCDVHPAYYSYDLKGIQAEISTPRGTFSLVSPLVGMFNLKNILAAAGVGVAMHLSSAQIRMGVSGITDIPGRLERVKSKPGVDIFVDYAHTPDALENVLATLSNLGPSRLICVFGCGGDRDVGKRSIMGEIAGRLCDIVLVTSDNPRTEKPEKILAQIEAGLIDSRLPRIPSETLFKTQGRQGYDLIVSRREAIRTAVLFSQTGDVVLISGKGHENYQITNTGRIFFDDRIEAAKVLRGD